jgi:hypothetical protein
MEITRLAFTQPNDIMKNVTFTPTRSYYSIDHRQAIINRNKILDMDQVFYGSPKFCSREFVIPELRKSKNITKY